MTAHVRTPAGLLVPPADLGGVQGIDVAKATTVGKSEMQPVTLVDRRTWRGLQPRPKKVPTCEADSAALRRAELKRRRKGAARAATLPLIGATALSATVEDVGRRYIYHGDRLTDPALKGKHCRAVFDERGKCVTGRGTTLVQFENETSPRAVLRRQLRKVPR